MAGTAPLKSLNAVTAPGNGITFDVQKARSDWEVQITTTGAPASFAAHLEGAIDGVTFVTVGSSITATGLTNVTSNTPLTQVRLVLDSLTGGTAPTVTGVIVGDGPAGSGGGGGGGAATIADGADQAEGAKADAAATTDTGVFSLIALFKRLLQKFTTQFPAALGGTTAANSFPVALSSDGTFATLSGAVTEAAPANDTASSGLNGRLQRIAQRLTTLITTNLLTQGDVAHDGVDSGNPAKIGYRAIAHGANPTAVAAADRTDALSNRAGVPFVIGGHPNVQTIAQNFTGAQTDTAIVTVATGLKLVVTGFMITCSNANTVNVSARLGFGTVNTPAYGAAQLIGTHPNIAPGSGFGRGGGSGIVGVGTDDQDLRLTCSVPTGGSVDCMVSYFTIES
jgi:hypothetical protein